MLQLTDGVDRSGKIAVDALPYVDAGKSLSGDDDDFSLFSNNLRYFFLPTVQLTGYERLCCKTCAGRGVNSHLRII